MDQQIKASRTPHCLFTQSHRGHRRRSTASRWSRCLPWLNPSPLNASVDTSTPTTVDTSTGFLSLPSELRNMVYELVLLHERPIDHFLGFYQKQTKGLLRTNKAVHREASSIFYGQNCFDFTDNTPSHLVSFLKQIGTDNAGYIQHVLIDFPEFHSLGLSHVVLKDDSIDILANLQSGCVNLSTLTTSLYTTTSMEHTLDDLENDDIVAEALQLVNARFRAISSLQRIVLQLYDDGPSDSIRRTMESHGWTLNTTPRPEEDWGGRFSDYGDDRYSVDDDSYGYDDGADDYSISNDSDFWRRAAD